MNDLLKKIYSEILIYEEDIISINKSTDEKVAELTAPYQQKLSDDEMEQLKSLLYAISLSAEQTGFEVGVRFAVQLLIKLLQHLGDSEKCFLLLFFHALYHI